VLASRTRHALHDAGTELSTGTTVSLGFSRGSIMFGFMGTKGDE
jgi:hypothetical protein